MPGDLTLLAQMQTTLSQLNANYQRPRLCHLRVVRVASWRCLKFECISAPGRQVLLIFLSQMVLTDLVCFGMRPMVRHNGTHPDSLANTRFRVALILANTVLHLLAGSLTCSLV